MVVIEPIHSKSIPEPAVRFGHLFSLDIQIRSRELEFPNAEGAKDTRKTRRSSNYYGKTSLSHYYKETSVILSPADHYVMTITVHISIYMNLDL